MIQDMCILIRTFPIPTTFHIFALVEGWILYRVVYFLHNFEWRTWNLSLISKCTCNSTVKAIFFWLHNYSAQLLLTVHCSWKVNFYFLFHVHVAFVSLLTISPCLFTLLLVVVAYTLHLWVVQWTLKIDALACTFLIQQMCIQLSTSLFAGWAVLIICFHLF